MGLTITGKYKGSPSYDMGYISFYRLRRDIACTVSEEFGKHYASMPDIYVKPVPVEEYDKQTIRLIRKYHCKKSLVSFLYQPDADGKLSPYMCKVLYDQIESMESNAMYGYGAYPERCLTINKFRDLLKECSEKGVYLVWY